MLGNWFAQINAVTVMNLRNVRERLGSTLVALVGVAGVVTVVVGVLSIPIACSACAVVRRTTGNGNFISLT